MPLFICRVCDSANPANIEFYATALTNERGLVYIWLQAIYFPYFSKNVSIQLMPPILLHSLRSKWHMRISKISLKRNDQSPNDMMLALLSAYLDTNDNII